MLNRIMRLLGRRAAGTYGMPHKGNRILANKGSRRRTHESTKDLVHQAEIETGAEDDHDETTCLICYEDLYGHPPENPEDFKHGKRYRIIPAPPDSPSP